MARRFKAKTPFQRIMKKHRYKYKYNFKLAKPGYFLCKCPIHGAFEVGVLEHSNGQGCLRCLNLTVTHELFIKLAQRVHGQKYTYPKAFGFNPDKDVAIKCKTHGTFTQKAWAHLHGSGCPYCAKGMMSGKQFIKEAKKVHGDKYSYSKVPNGIIRDVVEIVCKEHGVFKQSHTAHLNGGGCKDCSYKGGKWFYIYVIQCTKHKRRFYKIGISDDADRRYKELQKGLSPGWKHRQIAVYRIKATHGVFSMENYILSNVPGRPVPKSVISCGHTETKVNKLKPDELLDLVEKLIRKYKRNDIVMDSQMYRYKEEKAKKLYKRTRPVTQSKTRTNNVKHNAKARKRIGKKAR